MPDRHFPRLQSVEMEPMDDSSDNSNHTWLQDGINSMQLKRSEMNALIMDYLVHEGFKEAAERFKEEAGIQSTNIFITNNHHQNIHNQDKQPESTNLNTNANTSSSSSTTTTTTTSVSSSAPATTTSTTNTTTTTTTSNTTTNITATPHTNNSHQNNSTTTTSINKNNDCGETSMILDTAHDLTNTDNNNKQNGFFHHVVYDTDWISKAETSEMMDKRIEVRRLIEEGYILKAQSLINLYYPELLDNQRNLYFRLQQQHLIELIRKQKISEVLVYVHDQLSVDELRDLTEMERTLALLAYDKPDKSPYASLLHSSHRLQLASEMNDRILKETIGYIEPTKPRLVTLLKLLFWTQNELEKKKIQFPKMTDLVNSTIIEPRH